jgi:Lar family restriction alleviation protein
MTAGKIVEQLKPCPFCGGEAQRFTIGDDEPTNAGGDCISCAKCGASSHVEFGYKENLVSIWNTRAAVEAATITSLTAEVETVKACLSSMRPRSDDAAYVAGFKAAVDEVRASLFEPIEALAAIQPTDTE